MNKAARLLGLCFLSLLPYILNVNIALTFMLLEKYMRDLKLLVPSTTTSCQCIELCFSCYQANGKGKGEWGVSKWALHSGLDTRKGENTLLWEELIPFSQVLLGAWLTASWWLPLLAGKVCHCCLLRAVSKSIVAPCQALQVSVLALSAARRDWQGAQSTISQQGGAGTTGNAETRLYYLIVHLQTFDLGAFF